MRSLAEILSGHDDKAVQAFDHLLSLTWAAARDHADDGGADVDTVAQVERIVREVREEVRLHAAERQVDPVGAILRYSAPPVID